MASSMRLQRKTIVTVLVIAVNVEGQWSVSIISCNLPDSSHAPCILPARRLAHDDSAGLALGHHSPALARAKLCGILRLPTWLRITCQASPGAMLLAPVIAKGLWHAVR